MEFVITWRELVLAVVLSVVLYMLESVLFPVRRRRGETAHASALEHDVEDLKASLSALQARIHALEDGRIADDSEVAEGQSAYDYAIQYARQGMIAPEIAARCGISQAEAALIIAVHRRKPEA